MDTAAAHVAVLSHAHVTVPEVIRADSGRQTFVVDQCRDSLAETVSGGVPEAEFVTCRAPFLGEIVGVAQRACRGREDTSCSPRYGRCLRFCSISIANFGSGRVRRPAVDLVSSTRISPCPAQLVQSRLARGTSSPTAHEVASQADSAAIPDIVARFGLPRRRSRVPARQL